MLRPIANRLNRASAASRANKSSTMAAIASYPPDRLYNGRSGVSLRTVIASTICGAGGLFATRNVLNFESLGFENMRRIAGLLLLASLIPSSMTINAQDRRDPWDYGQGRDYRWDPSWNSRPFPRRGACFFTDRDFRDNISSIQTVGSRVIVFNDRDYRGGSDEFRTSVRDLRNRRFRDGHTWNNRISSIVVR